MEINDIGWTERAACRDHDPELFFPVSDMGPGAQQVAEAKAVCARCPVQAECLKYAMDNGLNFGIFGGTTERDRRQLIRDSGRSGRQGQAA